MNDDRFRIQPKSTFDIAREWLVVKAYIEPHERFNLAAMLSDFADMLTKHLQFERDTYKKLAEDALMMQPPAPIIMNSDDFQRVWMRLRPAEAESEPQTAAAPETAAGAGQYEAGRALATRKMEEYARAMEIVEKLAAKDVYDYEREGCNFCKRNMSITDEVTEHGEDCPYRLAVELVEERKR